MRKVRTTNDKQIAILNKWVEKHPHMTEELWKQLIEDLEKAGPPHRRKQDWKAIYTKHKYYPAPMVPATAPAAVNDSAIREFKMELQVQTEQQAQAALSVEATNEDDQYDCFGKYIVRKMKTIESEEQRLFAEGLITQIMQKAALNKLSESSIIVENAANNLIYVKPSPSTP